MSNSDEDIWKKLRQVLIWIKITIADKRIIALSSLKYAYTFIDALYVVHPNMRSHNGGSMSFVTVIIYRKFSKQKLNAKSLTEE